MGNLYSPKNTLIIGTSEKIEARCEFGDARKNDDGTYDLDFERTEIFWDTTKTQTENGERLFLDEGGYSYKESELTFRED